MRLAVVSAHYPPNFVSGGTLVPQRTSQALRDRGVDVRVFAGWLGEERDPLDEWDELDATGLPVHWLATTPWTGWGDSRNFDNPQVTERFAAWCDLVQPDLVHCHSLQSLGAGPLGVAQERHIPTVVTLHDFWWWCARQFFCNTDHEPCSLVVDAGNCACQAGRPWLDGRAALLSPVLAACDRVIAVSESTGRVAVANGVDPDRLVVVENGIVAEAHRPPVVRAATGGRDGAIRFTFAGGPNPMKGVQVLAAAARLLSPAAPGAPAGVGSPGTQGAPGTPGAPMEAWSLACYGCEEVAELFDAGEVSVLPAFAPSQLDDVLDSTDVLLLPSVMRESYSLLAREALSRRVPVITSDSLGPEEVVRDGHNGLVVPAGDAAALAAAIRRLVAEDGVLRRLTEGCTAAELPSLEGQVEAYLATYEQLMAGEGCGAAVDASALPEAQQVRKAQQVRQVRRALIVVGIEGAPLRYRGRLAAEALELVGVHTDVRHYRDPEIAGLSAHADVVVVYRVPATVQVLHLIAGVQRSGVPVVFDVDDLIFDPSIAPEIPALSLLPPDEAALWLQGVQRYRLTMEQCDAYIGSTPMLVEHAAASVGLPSHHWPNGTGLLLARLSDDALHTSRSPGPLRIGYLSGTNTHDHDWAYIEPAIVRVMDDHPDLELWLVGLVEPTDRLDRHASRVHRRGLVHWTELPAILRDLDVNLAPMEPGSRFNEAKSAIKWLEAALTATPTVASPTGPFADAIADGVTGVLAADGTAWHARLGELLDDRAARARIGSAARREALLRYSPHLQARRYLEILQAVTVRDHGPAAVPPSLAFDEPPIGMQLEPYALPGPVEAAVDIERQRLVSDAPGPPSNIWRLRLAALTAAARDGGSPAGARLIVGFARRRLVRSVRVWRRRVWRRRAG